jgi:hypothetical protein
MNKSRLKAIALAAMSLAVFAGSDGKAIAGDTSSKVGSAQVIQLPAANNSVQTVTIWTSKTIPQSIAKIATPRNGVQRVIQLPASNSSMQSVTVWMDSIEKNIDVAPLK